MPERSVLATISFRKPGTMPPVFVAGTFFADISRLHEMQYTVDDSGENCFTAQVRVQPGQRYLYKFKFGQSDDWFVDEQCSTALDDQGSCANLLQVPAVDRTAKQPSTQLDKTYMEPRSSLKSCMPTVGGAAPAFSNSPTLNAGNRLDDPRPPSPIVCHDEANATDDDEDLKTPLFAHEAFVESDTACASFDHEFPDIPSRSPVLNLSFGDYTMSDVGIDDPLLERFPSERSSVIDTLRKIRSGYDDYHSRKEEVPRCPRDLLLAGSCVYSSLGARSRESPSPVSRRKETRLSHHNSGPIRSSVSLRSIAEESKASVRDVIDPSKRGRAEESLLSLADEDEGLTMRVVKI